MLGGRVEHAVDGEARQQDGRRPRQQRPVEAIAEAVGVEEGESEDEPVVRGPTPGALQRLTVGQQVPVAQGGSLRGAGGPRRVPEMGQVVRADRVQHRRRGVGEVDLGADDDDVVPAGVAHPPAPLDIVDHCRPDAGVAHDVGHLPLGVCGVGRHHDEPGPVGGHVGHDQGDGRRRAEQDPVTRRQPGPGEAPGHPTGRRLQLPGGHPTPARLEQDFGLRCGRPSLGPGRGQGPPGQRVVPRRILTRSEVRGHGRVEGPQRLVGAVGDVEVDLVAGAGGGLLAQQDAVGRLGVDHREQRGEALDDAVDGDDHPGVVPGAVDVDLTAEVGR